VSLAGTRTVRSVPELQKVQKLEQVGRIGDETARLLVAKALKARGGSFGAVLARSWMTRRNAKSEELEENELTAGRAPGGARIPKRGATVGEANSRTGGTRLRTEQRLEVGELGSWQPACGSADLVPTAWRHRLPMKRDGCTE
jgi:hypothetical protein